MLPKVPYIMRKSRRQEVAMGGINFSSVLRDGDIADSKGISARSYPYITTRKSRSKLPYTDVDAMTVFQGKLVTVKGGGLYWDGVFIGSVSGGEKQFAAINTKLVIMPDKVYLDATDGKIKPMEALVIGGGGTFTKDSVTVNNDSVVAIEGIGGTVKGNKLTVELKKTVWDGSAVVTVVDDQMNLTPVKSGSFQVTGYNAGHAPYPDVHPDEFAGEIYISGRWVAASMEYNHELGGINIVFAISVFNTSDINSTKYVEYACLNPLREGDITDVIFPKGDLADMTEATVRYYLDNRAYFDYEYNGTIIKITSVKLMRKNWEPLTTALSVGDPVSIYDPTQKAYIITTVSAVTDTTLTFGDTVSDFTVQGKLALYSNLAGTLPDFAEKFKVGDVVSVKGGSNDISFKIASIEGNILRAGSDIFTSETVEGVISVERAIPKLDYICESNNRLWGCSNKDRTIYASALGDPTNLYTYQGVSTDAWAVGVGSEEDFTACVAYDGAVLFFKEMKLHKVLGSYPAEYATYSYDIEGVQAGCHKSLAIINEVLYYKGIHGVFAFTGSPTLISSSFGEKEFTNAVAGNDGDTYYVSMRDREKDYLFAYETTKGIWVLEGDERVTDFARIGSRLYMLEGGEVSLYGAEETSADEEWFVQFTPLYETIEGRKSYSRLLLRVELPEGSYMIVEARFDGGAWREAGKVIGHKRDVIPVAVPVNRCDRFELRLRGKGKATVLSILREYYTRSDK